MGWLKERFAVFEDAETNWRLLLAIAFFAFGLVGDTLVSAVQKEDGMIFSVPIWAWGLILGLLFFAWWLLEYAVKLRRRVTGGRTKLSLLRTTGVDIRNRGKSQFADQNSWLAWKKEAEDWEQDVIAALAEINAADAEWFKVLDVVPPQPRIPFYKARDTSDPHENLYRHHDLRLDRLGNMIRELWRENR